jgi:hypothetical protein
MATSLTSFLPYVLPHVVGCTNMLAEQAVLSSCIEFCGQSLLIQELAVQTVTAGVQDYTIDIPAYSVIARVLGVIHEDTWLTPNSIENVRSGVAMRGDVGSSYATDATPIVYFQKTPTSDDISLYPIPVTTIVNGLAIRTAFTPSRSATTVDDTLYNNWLEPIAAGAIARLMLLPGQPFSAPALAGSYRVQFDAATRHASTVARAGQVAASSRVQLTHFA